MQITLTFFVHTTTLHRKICKKQNIKEINKNITFQYRITTKSCTHDILIKKFTFIYIFINIVILPKIVRTAPIETSLDRINWLNEHL